ncbi:colicin E3/pyocin S6 family cytotoxin [Paenibacillus hubeiensis]|uniref:colicin E3/pyocin S6 family cytotoxin n=1 Tax=Paenibacillus hubeiensis TaxID=3077330 RepID=UPI0031BA55D1
MSNIDWSKIPASQYPFLKDKIPTGRTKNHQMIYKDKKGKFYYHKDEKHGEIEKYNSRYKHVGVITPEGDPHPKKKRKKDRDIKDQMR